ncbi:serine hydroxymethyltransferase [Dethiosulfatarculus sandiegensis]|uniref:Probable serine hydroxymethyltransferase n=1 Tax=Dethiosulfatarculus sandiegensis TaxID=1429043 RepID=A0A0D2JVW9_9BACT|nr:serine hydroxymethyltransferase [Dethiosulfatarculus sandiegensis]KIX13760.1 serine hydroxymethyltransferase [Dethiosulfatarculus sandiegensis]
MQYLPQDDPVVAELIQREETRIENTLDLIAAENHSPLSVAEALGSIFNTKTIEGYPGKRFHAGCENADEVENLAIERAKELFGAEYVNVQPHSGTSSNLAVYFSVLKPGDRILAMSLPHGGHLSHGHQASITSKCFNFKHYTVNTETELLDYDQIREMALEFKPNMIVAGASAYPRLIDYQAMSEVAKEVGAYLLADVAHLGGLVAAGVIPSPVPHCDFVTFTCYKTMMGGRGGVILSREKYGAKLNRAIFPGCQGTSAVNMIAAKAVIFKLALEPEFKAIQQKTIENAHSLASELEKRGFRLVTGGTDNHQVIIDVTQKGVSGAKAEKVMESVGLIANRNMIPADADKKGSISGIRLGTAGITVRKMAEPEMAGIAALIDDTLKADGNREELDKVAERVLDLAGRFPVYK